MPVILVVTCNSKKMDAFVTRYLLLLPTFLEFWSAWSRDIWHRTQSITCLIMGKCPITATPAVVFGMIPLAQANQVHGSDSLARGQDHSVAVGILLHSWFLLPPSLLKRRHSRVLASWSHGRFCMSPGSHLSIRFVEKHHLLKFALKSDYKKGHLSMHAFIPANKPQLNKKYLRPI